MAPKLPGKFDDISKTASSVLGDDFQCASFQMKAKQATNFGGATSDITVDYAPGADTKTPTKMSFKFPKPLPCLEGLAVDKLDFDKGGGIKMESSLGKALHGVDGLKVEVATDFGNLWKYSATYTGLKDTSVKFETNQSAPADFTAELMRGMGSSVIGAKLNGMSSFCPAMAVNYQSGDFFASVIAKNQFKEFTLHGLYSASADIKVAASFQQGGKTSGSWAVGGSAALATDLSGKAKFDSSNVISTTLKKDLAQGTKVFAGMSYSLNDGKIGYGAKLSIE